MWLLEHLKWHTWLTFVAHFISQLTLVWGKTTCIWVSALPHSICAALGKFMKSAVFPFLHLESGDNNKTNSVWLLWALNDLHFWNGAWPVCLLRINTHWHRNRPGSFLACVMLFSSVGRLFPPGVLHPPKQHGFLELWTLSLCCHWLFLPCQLTF